MNKRNLLKLLLFLLLLFLISPFICLLNLGGRNKDNYFFTSDICNNLYVEAYHYNRGIWGADIMSIYLTDSANFRIYVGKEFDDIGHAYFKCNGDTVFYFKETQSPDRALNTTKKIYILSELKRLKNY